MFSSSWASIRASFQKAGHGRKLTGGGSQHKAMPSLDQSFREEGRMDGNYTPANSHQDDVYPERGGSIVRQSQSLRAFLQSRRMHFLVVSCDVLPLSSIVHLRHSVGPLDTFPLKTHPNVSSDTVHFSNDSPVCVLSTRECKCIFLSRGDYCLVDDHRKDDQCNEGSIY